MPVERLTLPQLRRMSDVASATGTNRAELAYRRGCDQTASFIEQASFDTKSFPTREDLCAFLTALSCVLSEMRVDNIDRSWYLHEAFAKAKVLFEESAF